MNSLHLSDIYVQRFILKIKIYIHIEIAYKNLVRLIGTESSTLASIDSSREGGLTHKFSVLAKE